MLHVYAWCVTLAAAAAAAACGLAALVGRADPVPAAILAAILAAASWAAACLADYTQTLED